jgi:hypothetical protein
MVEHKLKKLMRRKNVYKAMVIFLALGLMSVMFWPMMKSATGPEVVVYKSPTCGCCTKWVSYLRNNGFNVTQIDTRNLKTVKKNQGIPERLGSCHTAIVEGYFVEGHVPVKAIRRMLDEKPSIKGIAVPGMPIGTPGMEQGVRKEPYDVLAIHPNGTTTIYERYQN